MLIRQMEISELGRIDEIDRSERITQQYKSDGGVLEVIEVDIDAARWGEPGAWTVQQYVDSWKPLLDGGGVLLGALDGDRLVGFAIYDPCSSARLANLAALYVSKSYRRQGIARGLTDEVVRLARSGGASRLYVSATPTRGTVDFYLRQGFQPLVTPDERMLALEPDDIHMERKL